MAECPEDGPLRSSSPARQPAERAVSTPHPLVTRLYEALGRGAGELEATRVLLIRHADVWNPTGVFYGRLPRVPLSALGRRQAASLRNVLRRCAIASFHASPLLRARQTAQILAESHPGLVVHRASALSEVRSSWSGVPFTQLPPRVNIYHPPRSVSDETIAQIAERMQRFVLGMVTRQRGLVTCCVSHGDPIAAVRALWLGKPLDLDSLRGANRPERCSITLLTFPSSLREPCVEYFETQEGLWPEAERSPTAAKGDVKGWAP